MNRTITLEVGAAPEAVSATLADVSSYPAWLSLVHRVEPADTADGDDGPAFWVTLRAVIGPLARSKRLRMVQGRRGPAVVLVRREVDGREHSPWEMQADVESLSLTRSQVVVQLHYGGRFWTNALDGVLDRSAAHAAAALGNHLGPSPQT